MAHKKPMSVFVSYAHADKERAHQIVDQLRDEGISVWIDQATAAGPGALHGGDDFGAEIVESIDRCTVFLLLMSPASMNSKHVRQEAKLAFERERPILPVLLAATPVPLDLEYVLQGILYLEADAPGFQAKLLRAVRTRMVESSLSPRRKLAQRLAVGATIALLLLVAAVGFARREYQACTADVAYFGSLVPALNATDRNVRRMLRTWRAMKDDASLLNPDAHRDIADTHKDYWNTYQEMLTAWDAHATAPHIDRTGALHASFEEVVEGYKDLHDQLIQNLDGVGAQINRLELSSKRSDGSAHQDSLRAQEAAIHERLGDTLVAADYSLERVSELQREFVGLQARECGWFLGRGALVAYP